MDYVEIQATFVVPEERADAFATILSAILATFAIPKLIAERFWYYGVWVNEWLGADPPDGDRVIVYSEGDKINELAKTFASDYPEEDDDLTEEEAFIFGQEKFSREKKPSPSLDKKSSHVRSSDAQSHVIENDLLPNINEDVVPPITRKYYPMNACLTRCKIINSDRCRLACDKGQYYVD